MTTPLIHSCSFFGLLLSSTVFCLLIASTASFGSTTHHDHLSSLFEGQRPVVADTTTTTISTLANAPRHSSSSYHGSFVSTTLKARRRNETPLTEHAHVLAAAGFLVLSAGSTMVANAATTESVVEKGQAIFESTCAACHKGGSNAIAKERSLTKEALTKFLGPLENGSDDIQNFVQNSNVHRGALVFSGRLTEEDYSNVAAYVYNQAMENKW
mmetsp:Transcript_6697/g.12599  ORF Transcript_6697/g.12599 Transcript_6697/m.12599 type:complete len:213 (+) Transcript_6697:89-727(+)|eukprot:CAMPEP_0176495746 /NCGR_PEP_ID=MMETSP0200_2-20121128/10829_1 /TAXON_ID=947934 /ORGANISM="Chaetoceros sp., Strain GSL56" /LENGTH=212 /DNA_ID=CAMNT_0017893661 /DNA_START=157 /DNA_END=795 /DNA_ORIENTATION=+